MNAISEVFHRLIFAVACIVGWSVFPILIAAGAAALVCYSMIAELFLSMVDEVYPAAGESSLDTSEGASADGLCRPIHP